MKRNRQSLDDAMNQLKRIKTPTKYSMTSSLNDKYQLQSNKKQSNKHNIIEMTLTRVSSEIHLNKALFASQDSTPKISKPILHPKVSTTTNSPITNERKILRPITFSIKDNNSSNIIFSPESTNNNINNTNPRFTKDPLQMISTPLQISEQTTTLISTSKSRSIKQPSNRSTSVRHLHKTCNYRVHFSNFKQMNTKKSLIETSYKFGLRLLDEPNGQKRAAYYIKRAADQGHIKAMFLYGTMLYDGYRIGMSRKMGIQMYKRATFRGDYKMMEKYRPIRFDDDGIKKNRKEAARYFKMAADLGDMNSMRRYRSMLYEGDGIEKDRKLAAFYFKFEADMGVVQSIRQYGSMLCLGDGVEKNTKEAARYFKLAAEKGDPQAMRKLAYLFQTGRGVDLDKKEAARYYKMAADLGDAIAMRQLAVLLNEGAGVKKNIIEAQKYLKLAIDKGDKVASKKYKDLFGNLDENVNT